MRFANGVDVIVHRAVPGGVDQYGDPIPGTVTTHVLAGVALAPRTGGGFGDVDSRSRAGVVVGLTMYAAHDADIRPTDRVEIDGELWEVDGEPGRWASPFTGRLHGCQVALKRAEG